MRGPEVAELYGSIDKVAEKLGWEPAIPIGTSLKDVYSYWFDSCVS